MPRNYHGQLTLQAATPTSLLTLLNLAGFTVTPIGKHVTIQNSSGAILYKGHNSSLSSVNGYPIAAGAFDTEESGTIDLSQTWLLSVAGGPITVKVLGL